MSNMLLGLGLTYEILSLSCAFLLSASEKEKLSRSVDHRTIAVCTHTWILNKHWEKKCCTTIMVKCMSLVGAYLTFGHLERFSKSSTLRSIFDVVDEWVSMSSRGLRVLWQSSEGVIGMKYELSSKLSLLFLKVSTLCKGLRKPSYSRVAVTISPKKRKIKEVRLQSLFPLATNKQLSLVHLHWHAQLGCLTLIYWHSTLF